MGLERFDIVLDQAASGDAPAFSAGQTVTGSVVAWVHDKETLYGFYLEVDGRAKVSWNEGSSDNSTTYSSKERYFRTRIALDRQPSDRFELGAGLHQYPFTFELPRDIPSSFEGKFGNVRYAIKAVMKRSWYKHDHICKIPIIVKSIVELNAKIEEEVPTKTEHKGHMGFSLTGQITATAWLDRAGYAPGETILFNAKIDNQSGSTIDGTTVQFIRRETYMAKKRKTTHKKIILEEAGSKIRDGTVMCWENFSIAVPNLPPSGLPHCNIIDIEYEIKLIVDPGLLSSNLVATLGIFISTMPIRSVEIKAADGRVPCPAQFPVDRSAGSDNRAAQDADTSAALEALACLSIDPGHAEERVPETLPPSYNECLKAGLAAGNTGTSNTGSATK